jgi:hypothetical protein
MYFRNFSINVKKNIQDYGTSENTSYPVIAMWTSASEKKMGPSISDPANTHFLIANDTFEFRWITSSDCEQVDLT